MSLLALHRVPSYNMIAVTGVAIGFSLVVTVSAFANWQGANDLAVFAWGISAGLPLVGSWPCSWRAPSSAASSGVVMFCARKTAAPAKPACACSPM